MGVSCLTHHFESDEIYFGQIAEEMGKDLQHASSSGVGMYSLAGELLYASHQGIFGAAGDDLEQALQGKTAYTISSANGGASVLFAYPVVINGTKVGILRFAKDFTPLYEQSNNMQRTIFSIALAVFAAAFLFSYILSRHITVPVVKLTQASTEVMNGNLHVRTAFKQKDEIGRLAANFSSMIEDDDTRIVRPAGASTGRNGYTHETTADSYSRLSQDVYAHRCALHSDRD